MPAKTVKNNRYKKHILKPLGTSVQTVTVSNTTRKIKYKLPINFLPPAELLKAKQKNKVNTKRNANKKQENQAKKVAAAWVAKREEAKRKADENKKKQATQPMAFKASNLLGITKKNAETAYKNQKRKEFENFLNKSRKASQARSGRVQTPKQILKGKFWDKNSNSNSD